MFSYVYSTDMGMRHRACGGTNRAGSLRSQVNKTTPQPALALFAFLLGSDCRVFYVCTARFDAVLWCCIIDAKYGLGRAWPPPASDALGSSNESRSYPEFLRDLQHIARITVQLNYTFSFALQLHRAIVHTFPGQSAHRMRNVDPARPGL